MERRVARRLAAEVGRDLRAAGADLPALRVRVPGPPRRGEDPADADLDPGELGMRLGGHWFRVPAGLAYPEALAYVADKVQDDVVDLLGRPWPEVRTQGGPAGGRQDGTVVLEAMVTGGVAVWRARTRPGPSCPVGRLVRDLGGLLLP